LVRELFFFCFAVSVKNLQVNYKTTLNFIIIIILLALEKKQNG